MFAKPKASNTYISRHSRLKTYNSTFDSPWRFKNVQETYILNIFYQLRVGTPPSSRWSAISTPKLGWRVTRAHTKPHSHSYVFVFLFKTSTDRTVKLEEQRRLYSAIGVFYQQLGETFARVYKRCFGKHFCVCSEIRPRWTWEKEKDARRISEQWRLRFCRKRVLVGRVTVVRN